MNVSSDIFNGLGLGMNEIDSFNKTLNEMLSVWNLPVEQQPQQPQPQQQQNIINSSNNINSINSALDNILNTTSKGIQLPRFNLLNTSSSGFLTNSNDTLFLENNNNNNNNNNINQQLNKSVLNSSNKQLDIIKTINEISNEHKSFQPFEITPIKPQTTSTTNTYSTEFGVINQNTFVLDSNKIEELRVDTSVLDPLLSLPYNIINNNNTTNNNSNNNNNNNNIYNKSNTPMKKESSIRNSNSTFEKSESPTLSTTTFGLNKEELNTFTTTDMNNYVKQANMVKELSQVEKKELKRQKRLIKNRESAHLSRQRKRERLTDLEHRVEELSSNSIDINKTLSSLENENLILKAEVGQLFEVINDSPVLSALFYKIASLSQQPQKDTVGAY
ncbi:hypothetical protein ACTFIR_000976 [Dictyostelium discoideum]